MANNRYYNHGNAIFLEFNYVLGTDSIMYIDGRINNDSAHELIIEKATEIRKRKPGYFLRGYSRSGDYSHKIESLPEYVLSVVNRHN